MLEARQVSQFRHQSNSRRELDAPHGLQRQYRRIETPARQCLAQCPLQPFALGKPVLNGAPVFIKGQLLPFTPEAEPADPPPVRRAPVGPPAVTHIVRQQERFQPPARLSQILARARPGTCQIAKCLILDIRHMYRAQIARAQRAHQFDRIAPVGLHPLTGLAWNQRRRTHHALEALVHELPV